jgi:MYXO-CTERM domain-containing protein
VDVGFLDSGSGKIEARTKFSFKVTRAHGYEAGEYKVTIKDTRNGQTVGTPTTLKFQGENETVDRRAMVFASKDKKKEEKKAEGDKPADEAKKDDDGGGASDAKPEETPVAETPPADEGAEANGPPPIEEKPGGCGCKVAGGRSSGAAGALALIGVVGLGLRRRRAGSGARL